MRKALSSETNVRVLSRVFFSLLPRCSFRAAADPRTTPEDNARSSGGNGRGKKEGKWRRKRTAVGKKIRLQAAIGSASVRFTVVRVRSFFSLSLPPPPGFLARVSPPRTLMRYARRCALSDRGAGERALGRFAWRDAIVAVEIFMRHLPPEPVYPLRSTLGRPPGFHQAGRFHQGNFHVVFLLVHLPFLSRHVQRHGLSAMNKRILTLASL